MYYIVLALLALSALLTFSALLHYIVLALDDVKPQLLRTRIMNNDDNHNELDDKISLSSPPLRTAVGGRGEKMKVWLKLQRASFTQKYEQMKAQCLLAWVVTSSKLNRESGHFNTLGCPS